MDTEVQKAPDRLKVLDNIAENERRGFFAKDVEEDPIWEPVDPDSVDFCGTKISTKIKTRFANFMGNKFFRRSMRRKEVIFAGVTGLENLEDIKGGAIVTCNHINRFDNFAVFLGLRKFYGRRFRMYKIIREGNYGFPGKIGFFMRYCNTLPINESNNYKLTVECMKGVKHHLSRGKKILIYPEQGMWWNYRKPRPLKKGAFLFAAKFDAPVIPCFLSLEDSDIMGKDGFWVQRFTLNILPPIYPDPKLNANRNCEMMRDKNYIAWKDAYEKIYGRELVYDTEAQSSETQEDATDSDE